MSSRLLSRSTIKLPTTRWPTSAFSKGFKSGGFTQRIFPPEPSATPFTPEYVDSYEFGFKNEFFDKKVRLNAAAFFTDYTGLQIVVNDPGNIAPKVRNAGKANINGGELEGEWIVTDWLRFNGGLGFTDANYREVGIFAQNAGVTLGSKLPYTPKWTGTIGASADVWENELGILSVRADGAFKSSYFPAAVNQTYTDPDGFKINAGIIRQSGYATLNLAATFNTTDDQWQITGWRDQCHQHQVSDHILSRSGRRWRRLRRLCQTRRMVPEGQVQVRRTGRVGPGADSLCAATGHGSDAGSQELSGVLRFQQVGPDASGGFDRQHRSCQCRSGEGDQA